MFTSVEDIQFMSNKMLEMPLYVAAFKKKTKKCKKNQFMKQRFYIYIIAMVSQKINPPKKTRKKIKITATFISLLCIK